MIIARTYFSILLGRISGGTSLPASKHDIHQQRRDPWWLQYVYDDYGQVKRNIFSAAPPGAGAAGAALAGLLAGLVPGEKLAMGCWMLVAQAARTGFPNCIVPRFQIGVGSFVWNTQKSRGCRTRTPYSLYKGQTMFFGQPHFYLFPNFHYSLLKSLMIKSLQNSLF